MTQTVALPTRREPHVCDVLIAERAPRLTGSFRRWPGRSSTSCSTTGPRCAAPRCGASRSAASGALDYITDLLDLKVRVDGPEQISATALRRSGRPGTQPASPTEWRCTTRSRRRRPTRYSSPTPTPCASRRAGRGGDPGRMGRDQAHPRKDPRHPERAPRRPSRPSAASSSSPPAGLARGSGRRRSPTPLGPNAAVPGPQVRRAGGADASRRPGLALSSISSTASRRSCGHHPVPRDAEQARKAFRLNGRASQLPPTRLERKKTRSRRPMA